MSQYAAVWARAADEVLPALAALEPLRHTPHLKYKIVFSVVVVSIINVRLEKKKTLLIRSKASPNPLKTFKIFIITHELILPKCFNIGKF